MGVQQLLLLGVAAATALSVGTTVMLGSVEVVRDSLAVTCGSSHPPPQTPGQHYNLDIPDEPCRAWKTAQNGHEVVTMLATHTAARYDHGVSLGKLQHDCRIAFNSSWNPDPSRFDDRTWLMSPWLSAPGVQTVYALAHMEFHGWSDVVDHARCLNATSGKPMPPVVGGKRVEPGLCWYNAVVLLKSVDGASTFTHALPPPHHLVATAPYKYPQFASVGMGYGAVLSLSTKFLHSRGVRVRGAVDWDSRCLPRVEPAHTCDSIACLSGVCFLSTVITMHRVATLKANVHELCHPLMMSYTQHHASCRNTEGDFSNVYHNPKDGFLYVFINSRNDYKAMKAGQRVFADASSIYYTRGMIEGGRGGGGGPRTAIAA
jgi:hypothetical protein